MAIRFVDKGSEDKRASRPERSKTQPVAAPAIAVAQLPRADIGPPVLPHAKPEPKPRGRKTPPSVAPKDQPVITNEPAQATLDGVLPSLPHPKPEPKPRGRKKAFG
jgi:hypothetical protein